MLVHLLLGLSLAGPAAHTFPPSVRTLDLHSVSGNVTVRTGAGAIAVKATPRVEDSMCEIVFEGTDGGVVHSRPRGVNSNVAPRDCTVDFEVTLPSGAAFKLELKSGNLDFRHDGPLDGGIEVGNVEGTTASAVNLRVGTGNVALGALTQPVELKVNKGNAALVFASAPAGTILVNVAAGGVHIDLPDDAVVDARVPPGVSIPQTQKTTAETKLLIGKVVGTVTVE